MSRPVAPHGSARRQGRERGATAGSPIESATGRASARETADGPAPERLRPGPPERGAAAAGPAGSGTGDAAVPGAVGPGAVGSGAGQQPRTGAFPGRPKWARAVACRMPAGIESPGSARWPKLASTHCPYPAPSGGRSADTTR